MALKEAIPGFAEPANSIFRTIATTYNGLQDADFHFSGYGRSEAVNFPTGYETPDGQPILLLCTKRNGNRGYGWYFNSATYEGAGYKTFD